MTTLVTGGAGFIGSHLVEALLCREGRVVVVDDFSRGRAEYLAELRSSAGFSVVHGDICDRRVLERAAKLGPFEAVYHLAAMHFIPECVERPAETLSINVVGTQSLLDLVPCRRFVMASTGDVYAPRTSCHREDDPTEPFNVYGLSKLFGEQVLEVASRQGRDSTFVAARLFNVYGPRETNPHLIPELVRQAKAGQEIHLGSLWPRRDYTFVSDTVDALLALEALEAPATFDVFNVGTGTAISVQDLVEVLGEVLGRPLTVTSDEARVRSVERPHLQADIAKITRATGWQPRFGLREGLALQCRSEGIPV